MNLAELDGKNGFRLDGVSADDRSGHAVASAGDVNGDGIADLLVGAYRGSLILYVEIKHSSFLAFP